MIIDYKSKKINGIFKKIYIFLFLFMLLMPLPLLLTKNGLYPFIVMESIFTLIISILIVSILKLKISIQGNFLVVKIIFTLYKTDINKIYKIRKGETMWSGFNKFGTSTNGLIIFTKHRNDLYITPENEELFLDELKKNNPNIILEKI
ncbi:PH domain-containing protein [Flavobacterium dankookense]|uniref:PH (Pleckstrin Homology) domain-containing protein n=1 Tax=Flavobacterium dankookense TaxID=706186 RepID=A0A4R6Q8B2_9FLAO|nr:PH domain-containing protein [Flavobacterium dankookense]TDP58360.1 PH (Pleckstrin Homology) domain-containing protein [Flavobacterium dankookense]